MPRDAVVADLEDERDERQRREEDGEEGTEGRPAESDASDERRGQSFAKMRDTRGSSRRVEGVGLLVWSADGRRHRGKRRDGEVSRPKARTIFAGPFALRPCAGA